MTVLRSCVADAFQRRLSCIRPRPEDRRFVRTGARPSCSSASTGAGSMSAIPDRKGPAKSVSVVGGAEAVVSSRRSAVVDVGHHGLNRAQAWRGVQRVGRTGADQVDGSRNHIRAVAQPAMFALKLQ